MKKILFLTVLTVSGIVSACTQSAYDQDYQDSVVTLRAADSLLRADSSSNSNQPDSVVSNYKSR